MAQQTVLVVEDSTDIRQIVVRVLAKTGFQVLEAENGITGVELAHRHRPALVLLDINLPGMDGFEVMNHLRADPAMEETPVIAITAYAVASTERMAQRIGCQRVLFKPFDIGNLADEVNELLLRSASSPYTA